jgi:hypothetical protein
MILKVFLCDHPGVYGVILGGQRHSKEYDRNWTISECEYGHAGKLLTQNSHKITNVKVPEDSKSKTN